MKQKYIELEELLIQKYNIDIVENSSCRKRTHAHCDKTRRICKWKKVNSINSLFTLAHEIGHIETNKSKYRRCEQEYYATQWAIDTLYEYGIDIPAKIKDRYQKYIDMEWQRGMNRNGSLPPKSDLRLMCRDRKLEALRDDFFGFLRGEGLNI